MAETALQIVCGNCGYSALQAQLPGKLCPNCTQPLSIGKHGRGTGNQLVKAGDVPLLKRVAREFAPTRARLKLVDEALKISEQPDEVERAYMARQLVLCTLPHSDPGDASPRWLRRTGNQSLIVQAGWDGEEDKSFGYPYGSIPRLILFWITTEVQRTKNRADLTEMDKRTLELGRSLNDFMRAVGLNPATGGGKRGDGKRLHGQMDRLFNARITFQETAQVSHLHMKGRHTENMEVAPQHELWWDVRQPDQGSLWNSWIRLGEEFYKALTILPVPVDMRALRALKRSPLALDLYAWLCYRSFVIVQKKQPPQFTAWETLMRQLGADYTAPDDFRKKAIATLRKVRAVYPGLNIGKAKGGFTVHATRLAVPQKLIG